ncbi:MAG: TIM barrel protein [Thermodesulfobacteriota bacterium]
MKIALTATQSEVPGGPIIMRGSIKDAFALASQLGYDGVELHIRCPSEINRDEVKKLADKYGLGIPTLGTGMAATQEGLTFSDPNPDIRHRAVTRIKEHIALAAHLNSAVTIGSINGRLGNDPQKRPIHREAALDCLKECSSAAAEAGVTILLEPLNRYECDYLNTLEEGVKVIRQIGMPSLKLLADTFHMNIEEADITVSLRTAGPELGHVHLADTNRQAPGYGHLDVRGVLRVLRDMRYQAYLSFEVLPLPTFRQAAEDGIRTVREILSNL